MQTLLQKHDVAQIVTKKHRGKRARVPALNFLRTKPARFEPSVLLMVKHQTVNRKPKTPNPKPQPPNPQPQPPNPHLLMVMSLCNSGRTNTSTCKGFRAVM